MVKKMVYLDEDQDRIVKRLAREMGTSETEIIRRAVVAYGETDSARLSADKHRIREYVKAHPEGWADDPADWFRG